MACRTCGDKDISDEYMCGACHLENGTYKWCVISWVPDHDKGEDGNLADDCLLMTVKVARKLFEKNMGKKWVDKNISRRRGRKPLFILDQKVEVFQIGEIFPVDPDFEREIIGHGRKPGKWVVEYKLFKSTEYRKAVKFSNKVQKEYFNKKYPPKKGK